MKLVNANEFFPQLQMTHKWLALPIKLLHFVPLIQQSPVDTNIFRINVSIYLSFGFNFVGVTAVENGGRHQRLFTAVIHNCYLCSWIQ